MDDLWDDREVTKKKLVVLDSNMCDELYDGDKASKDQILYHYTQDTCHEDIYIKKFCNDLQAHKYERVERKCVVE